MQISPALKSAGAAVLGLLLLAPAALAADGESTPLDLSGDTKAKATETAGSASGGIVRTIVGLAIVIGVIYGLYWILKQVKASREEKASGVGLKTLATLPLGQNRAMHLVRAGDEVVLVGVGEHGVTPIRTYGEHEACSQRMTSSPRSSSSRPRRSPRSPRSARTSPRRCPRASTACASGR